MNDDSAPLYYIWKSENSSEGPLELPALIARVKNSTVRPETWVYATSATAWQPARSLSELQLFFRGTPQNGAAPPSPQNNALLKPGSLRRMKVFAEMNDDQLSAFIRCVDIIKFSQFSTIVRKGENGDAMYLVLEGELRARSMIDGRESTLSTMSPGDSFGEVSLLDHGPRSADVLANVESTVLKISAENLGRILREAPAAAAPFLHALGRSAVARIRTLTKKYEDSIHFSRVSGQA